MRNILRRWLCRWTGHEDTLVFAADRVFLECQNCGRETAGWQVALRRPEPPVVVKRIPRLLRHDKIAGAS